MIHISLSKTLTGSILDIGGGGEGIIGRLYGGQVTAIDNRADELAEAPDTCSKLLMDATALTFPNGSFDHVTCFYTLLYMDGEYAAPCAGGGGPRSAPRRQPAYLGQSCLLCLPGALSGGTVCGYRQRDGAHHLWHCQTGQSELREHPPALPGAGPAPCRTTGNGRGLLTGI